MYSIHLKQTAFKGREAITAYCPSGDEYKPTVFAAPLSKCGIICDNYTHMEDTG